MPRPWRLAFDAPADLPPLRHVLLGINAHVNYDLPQAMLAVISPDDFADPVLLGRRRRDHERIDAVLAGRVAAEDDQLSAGQTRAGPAAPAAQPAGVPAVPPGGPAEGLARRGRAACRPAARSAASYRQRLGELQALSAARIADLLAPGQVLLRLAVAGFGVVADDSAPFLRPADVEAFPTQELVIRDMWVDAL